MNTWTMVTRTLLLGVCMTACSVLAPIADRSRFFTLTASPVARADAAAYDDQAPGVIYGLGPIILPAYLDRNQVATRLSPTEIAYSQWDRWAEPLAVNISSVLRQQVASDLGTDAIVAYPWAGGIAVDYQVEVRLLRFESDTTGASYLVARWMIRDVPHDRRLLAKEISLTRPGKPNDTSASTAALSDMLGELGHEIATTLRDPPRRAAAPTAKRKRK
jgi:uncharacterized protein